MAADHLIFLATASLFVISDVVIWAQESGLPGTQTTNSAMGIDTQSKQTKTNTPASNGQEVSAQSSVVVPLSGADVFTPRSGTTGQSYLLSSLEWTGYGNTNPIGAADHSRLTTMSNYVGNFTLQRVRRHSQLNVNYSGGGFFYGRRIDAHPNLNPRTSGTFHSLGIRQTATRRRWELEFEDEGSYLPESPFGFAGFGGLNSFGGGLGGNALANAPFLNPALSPNQAILTGNARRLANVAVAQVQFMPAARSAITATAVFGTLNFVDPGFIDSNYWTFLTGYSHALSRSDTLAVNYVHVFFHLRGEHRDMLNRGFELSYAHKITGRLALNLRGGPIVTQIALPLGGVSTRSFVNTYDSLQYSFRKGNAEVSFVRYTTAGAGVLLGAESDLVHASVGRRFLRSWNASLSVGHAYNQSLTRQALPQRGSKYESWQAAFTLSRELGEHLSLYINYYAQRQISNSTSCFGNNCGLVILRQVGGVGINWHSRPIKIG